jgi:probable HAF family extracellular repeat protein
VIDKAADPRLGYRWTEWAPLEQALTEPALPAEGPDSSTWGEGAIRRRVRAHAGSTVYIGANDEGQVVGSSFTTGDAVLHAFLWTKQRGMVDLGTLGGTDSAAAGVNNEGQVVGGSDTTGDAAAHAFSWTKQRGMVDLGTLGGTSSGANAVNNKGQVVGYSYTTGDAAAHATMWR